MELMDAAKKAGKAVEKALTASPDENGDMDILDKLKMEHREVAAMLKELVETESAPTRKKLLKNIEAALIPHTRAEEKVVYNAIIAQKEKGAKIDGEEGYIEHHLVDDLLKKLDKMENATSPEFSAAAKVLKEMVEHHVKEEEHNVWKDVKEHFNGDARIEMNREFEAAKKKVKIAA